MAGVAGLEPATPGFGVRPLEFLHIPSCAQVSDLVRILDVPAAPRTDTYPFVLGSWVAKW